MILNSCHLFGSGPQREITDHGRKSRVRYIPTFLTLYDTADITRSLFRSWPEGFAERTLRDKEALNAGLPSFDWFVISTEINRIVM